MHPYTDTQKHPLLILIRGLPGSGKSYFAFALQKLLGENATVMLDPDAIDYERQQYKDHVASLTAEGVDPTLHAYRFSRAKAYQGITDHKIIIWNQPFTNLEIFRKMTDRLETHAAEQSTSLPILVVEIAIDPEVARKRVIARKQAGGHGPSDEVFERFIRDYASFTDTEYDTVSINGDDDVSTSTSLVMSHVARLLS